MRIFVTICLMLAAGTLVAGTTLYRWVDEQGRVHYSDQPQPEAEEIEVGEPTTFSRPAARQTTTRPRQAAQDDAQPGSDRFAGYKTVRVTAPTPDQVLWNIGGVLTVNVSLQPALLPGHSIRVSYNGSEVESWPAKATSHQIRDVYRGTHTVSVSIVDASGNRMATGEAVTFHVKQTSILN